MACPVLTEPTPFRVDDLFTASAAAAVDDGIIVDLFAGGGGASQGISWATGRAPHIAVNHDAEAIALHKANHPESEHFTENVWKVDPRTVCAGRRVKLLWASPDCTHHSKARGGKPVKKNIRSLAWVVTQWAHDVRPDVIALENVEEFADWGPLTTCKEHQGEHPTCLECKRHNKPCQVRKGKTFRAFCNRLRRLGYVVEHRILRANHYWAPTIRKRLFLVARCDGRPIVWPKKGERVSWPHERKTAADCIDWSIACPSIFMTKEEAKALGLKIKRPLVPNTMRRVANGYKKFVQDNPHPFIINLTHQGGDRTESIEEPFRTITGAHRGEKALVTPYLAGVGGRAGQSPERSVDKAYHTTTGKADTVLIAPYLSEHANATNARSFPADEPLRTQCAQVKGGHFTVIAPTLIQTGYGEREGQAPRSLNIEAPLGTVVGSSKHALVAAFMAKHFTERPGCVQAASHAAPVPTVTPHDHNALVASSLVKLRGTSQHGQPVDQPLGTISAQGNHFAEVRAFLVAYFGNEQDGAAVNEPMRTITSRDRFGLVTVEGVEYEVWDIGMRMLQPRELYRAQGFPDSYLIDIDFTREVKRKRKGKWVKVVITGPLKKDAQVRMVGNSVVPQLAAAIVRANLPEYAAMGRAA